MAGLCRERSGGPVRPAGCRWALRAGQRLPPRSERIFNTTLPQQGNLPQHVLILQAWHAAQLLCAVLQASGCGAHCSPSHCYAGPHLPSLSLSSPCKSYIRFMPSHLHGTRTQKHPIARTQFIFKSCSTFKSKWLASSASSDLTRDHEATLTVWYCLFFFFQSSVCSAFCCSKNTIYFDCAALLESDCRLLEENILPKL